MAHRDGSWNEYSSSSSTSSTGNCGGCQQHNQDRGGGGGSSCLGTFLFIMASIGGICSLLITLIF